MTAISVPQSNTGRLGEWLAQSPVWLWCFAAFTFVCAKGLVHNARELAQNYGDTDDATRMVQVRELIAGAPWFDTTIVRLGFPGEGLLSHWSRLIDLPLALLISFFQLFMPADSAEIVVRAIYPLMVLLPLIVILARTTGRVGGRLAALFALVLAVTCISALIQFQVGRIDHHNAMILGAAGAAMLLWTLPVNAKAAVPAGLLGAFSVAVGYEGLPIVAVASAAAAIWAVLDSRIASAVRQYAVTLAAAMAAFFVLTIAPSRWGDVHCDALSANLVVLTAICVAGLGFVLDKGDVWSWQKRILALAGAGVAGLAVYGLMEPACLKGPFGQVPPALMPVWVDHVTEAQSLFWFIRTSPGEGLACLLFLAVGVFAHITLYRQDRQPAQLFLAATFVVAALLSLTQIKYLPYASWLVLPPLAIVISRLKGSASLSRGTVLLAGMTLLNQSTILVATMAGANLMVADQTAEKKQKEDTEACFKVGNVAALNALPRGLIVTDIDLGPFIAVATDHSALAAPYHRIGPAILETQAILDATEADAKARLIKIGAKYVVACPAMAKSIMPGGNTPMSLTARLRRGDVPDFLEPMALSADTPLKAWRVRRE